MVNIEQILEAMWHLANGKDGVVDSTVYDCRVPEDVAALLSKANTLNPVEKEQRARLDNLRQILTPIAQYGTRFVSNRFEHYFIVQCPLQIDELEDAMEFESLDDMLESMAIVHDEEQEKLEDTAVIIRISGNEVVACDLKGCWRPFPYSSSGDDVAQFINDFRL